MWSIGTDIDIQPFRTYKGHLFIKNYEIFQNKDMAILFWMAVMIIYRYRLVAYEMNLCIGSLGSEIPTVI